VSVKNVWKMIWVRALAIFGQAGVPMVQERYRELLKRGETSPRAPIKALGDAVSTPPVLTKAEAAR
jgi:hypothetical protein